MPETEFGPLEELTERVFWRDGKRRVVGAVRNGRVQWWYSPYKHGFECSEAAFLRWLTGAEEVKET